MFWKVPCWPMLEVVALTRGMGGSDEWKKGGPRCIQRPLPGFMLGSFRSIDPTGRKY